MIVVVVVVVVVIVVVVVDRGAGDMVPPSALIYFHYFNTVWFRLTIFSFLYNG